MKKETQMIALAKSIWSMVFNTELLFPDCTALEPEDQLQAIVGRMMKTQPVKAKQFLFALFFATECLAVYTPYGEIGGVRIYNMDFDDEDWENDEDEIVSNIQDILESDMSTKMNSLVTSYIVTSFFNIPYSIEQEHIDRVRGVHGDMQFITTFTKEQEHAISQIPEYESSMYGLMVKFFSELHAEYYLDLENNPYTDPKVGYKHVPTHKQKQYAGYQDDSYHAKQNLASNYVLGAILLLVSIFFGTVLGLLAV